MNEFPYRSKQAPSRIPYEDKALEYLYQINFERGFIKGMAEAEAEGKKESKIEAAKLMKADGMAIEKIMLYTGLSEAEINEL
jgi:predicted transposase/invertase (TIGR01784 family)